MPMLNFVGVDNHGGSLLFGFALLNNSREDTFVWAFENFLKIMEKPPTIVYSDQEYALVNGIRKVFSEATQRFCAWHIVCLLQSTYSYLKSGTHKDQDVFQLMMNLPFTKGNYKFEQKARRIKEHLGTNSDYFDGYMDKKHDYARCYAKNKFSAGINTTSRIESLHSVLKIKTNSKTSLQELFEAINTIENDTCFKDEYTDSSKLLSIE